MTRERGLKSITNREVGFEVDLWLCANRIRLVQIVLCLVLTISHSVSAQTMKSISEPVSAEVSRIGDATHIEFSGAPDWKYQLKREAGSDIATLRVNGLNEQAIAKLKSLQDPLIKKVTVLEKSIDDSTEIAFSLAPQTDFFDYITDQPSRLIIDFFPPEQKNQTTEKPVATALPEKKIGKQKQTVISKAADEKVDDLDESKATQAQRVPAGEIGIVQKAELPPPPSVAEQLSSESDFKHGIFDGGDPEFRRFTVKDYEVREAAIVASRANFYLPFPVLELGVPQLKALLDQPPTYEIVANETRENKEARILLQLFSNKQRALFLKVAGEFLAKFPESKYDEIVRYMVADAHYDIWRGSASLQDFDTAMNGYLSLAEKYPESPMTPRTLLLMGYSYVDRGDSFGALKIFERYVRQYPKSKQIDRVQIAIGEAYLRLNRFDEAFERLDKIEKGAKSEKARQEAAYRKGDVFFKKKDYLEAIQQYRGAIKRYPAAAERFPNAWYNLAESQFITQQHREGLESYRSFLRKFPSHEHGGYAMTRMGELLGILGADRDRVDGAFQESFFRYRSSPGAGVARIRLLTSRMPSMSEKHLQNAMKEIDMISARYSVVPERAEKALAAQEKIAASDLGPNNGPENVAENAPEDSQKSSETAADKKPQTKLGTTDVALKRLVPIEGEDPTKKRPELPGIEEFSALLIADGHFARGDYDVAAKDLIAYYQQNPVSPNKDKIKIRIVRNLSEGIRAAVDRGNFMDALRRFSKNEAGWLKNTNRIDVAYNVGRAYEQAGVFKDASNSYRTALERLNSLKSKDEELERSVFENLPTKESIQLRMAAVDVKAGEFALAEQNLKNITKQITQTSTQQMTPVSGSLNGSQLTEAEQIERAELSAQVSEARGQSEMARKYLEQLIAGWKGDSQMTSPLHLRVARSFAKSRNFKMADEHLAKIIEWKKSEGSNVSDDVHAQALELRADLFAKRGKRAEAVKTYRELLSAYESARTLASVRYRLGQLLYQDGDLKGAEEAWKELKPEKDNIWYRLASEQMKGAKWQNEYKKYLQRIPAANDLRSSTETKASR